MAKRKTTIEDLAGMMKRGFDQVASTDELATIRKEMATKQDASVLRDEIIRVGDDVRDIKLTLGPLVRTVAALENDMRTLHMRVNRLEKKSGFTK